MLFRLVAMIVASIIPVLDYTCPPYVCNTGRATNSPGSSVSETSPGKTSFFEVKIYQNKNRKKALNSKLTTRVMRRSTGPALKCHIISYQVEDSIIIEQKNNENATLRHLVLRILVCCRSHCWLTGALAGTKGHCSWLLRSPSATDILECCLWLRANSAPPHHRANGAKEPCMQGKIRLIPCPSSGVAAASSFEHREGKAGIFQALLAWDEQGVVCWLLRIREIA